MNRHYEEKRMLISGKMHRAGLPDAGDRTAKNNNKFQKVQCPRISSRAGLRRAGRL
jgi:hypothetical protein